MNKTSGYGIWIHGQLAANLRFHVARGQGPIFFNNTCVWTAHRITTWQLLTRLTVGLIRRPMGELIFYDVGLYGATTTYTTYAWMKAI